MELRFADPASRADLCDDLAAANRVAALDEQRIKMRIGRDEAVGMLDEYEIAVAPDLVAGISDYPALDGPDRRAARRRDIDPGIAAALFCRSVPGEDATAHRPREMPVLSR